VILGEVREYEQSLPWIDEGWDNELLDDPFELQQRLMESHEPHGLLVSLVEGCVLAPAPPGFPWRAADLSSIVEGI